MNEPSAAAQTAVDRLPLGSFVLDLAAGELLSADRQPAGLRRQALEVLLVLGRRAGQVVGKDELMDLVWPDVVVGEGSLTQAIADVRRALGDTEHRLVRNVARRGYMLVPDAALDDAPALSIAVMPLDVEGDAEASDWLADALHGDLVSELTQVHDVVVMARDTAATYKGKPIDPRQVARELRVRYIVRGSLRYEGTVIRLNLALVDGGNGVQLWAESFVIERARLPQALAELAVQIVLVLRPELYRSAVAASRRIVRLGGHGRRSGDARIRTLVSRPARREHRRGAEAARTRGGARPRFGARLGRTELHEPAWRAQQLAARSWRGAAPH